MTKALGKTLHYRHFDTIMGWRTPKHFSTLNLYPDVPTFPPPPHAENLETEGGDRHTYVDMLNIG
jgi:hypothetical protein